MPKTITEPKESFSSKVKKEMSTLRIRRRDDAQALLCAFTLGIGKLRFVPDRRSWGVHYSLKSRPALEHAAKLCEQYFQLETRLSEVQHERLNANNCELTVFGDAIDDFMLCVGLTSIDPSGERSFSPVIPRNTLETDSRKRSFIKGLFLACGMVSDPQKAYHAEFAVENRDLFNAAFTILREYGIEPRHTTRKNCGILYVKEGEKLEDLLAFIGASEAVMTVSNERIVKQAKNKANRDVNCITANLNRATLTAGKQIEDIELVLKTLGAGALSDELRTVALARIDNRDCSLSELADELNMGRSAVNYRLRKLQKMAADIRSSNDE